MTNQEKLEALKAFLREKEVEYITNHQSHLEVVLDLKLLKLKIAVHVSDGNKEHDDDFYERTYRTYKPFFIRDSDSVEYVLEKMRNCIAIQRRRKKSWEKRKKRKEEGLKYHEECMQRHLEKVAMREAAAAKKAAKVKKRKRQRIVHAERVLPIIKNREYGE